ncbi:MAG TPA: A24 family peptidase [Candidatus Tectomicrobia bacterium]|nr:A24 family peptidase [Candidatus Tectomicrobia bacterium]
MLDSVIIVTAAALGLVIGSFLNVVIARLPERRSLLWPASSCPGCGAAIAWRDNIPVVSYLALRGRCRACAMAIPARYVVVEVATAALFVGAYVAFGPTLDALVAAVFLSALLAVTVIDLERQIIPDAITLPGILAGVVANLATGRVPMRDCVVGILLGGGLFFVIILASRGGMGGGDMKLGAMLGAFLGWKILLLAVFVAVLLGGIVAVVLMALGRRGRKDAIPFGPFLAAGGAAGMLWGEGVVQWYVSALL